MHSELNIEVQILLGDNKYAMKDVKLNIENGYASEMREETKSSSSLLSEDLERLLNQAQEEEVDLNKALMADE